MRRIDKERTEYHRYFTGREWMDMENYDLPINASRIDYDQMIQLIKDYLDAGLQCVFQKEHTGCPCRGPDKGNHDSRKYTAHLNTPLSSPEPRPSLLQLSLIHI